MSSGSGLKRETREFEAGLPTPAPQHG